MVKKGKEHWMNHAIPGLYSMNQINNSQASSDELRNYGLHS